MHRFVTRFIPVVLLVLSGAGCNSQPAPGGGGEKPVIGSFRAEPTTIAPGQASTLSWQVTGATSLSLAPDVGTVTGSSRAVSPTQTTEYTLTASNAAGDATDTTKVTVDGGGNGDEAEPLHDTIAYASGNGDEIRLIDPDGTNDRRLWAHGLDDPEGIYEVWNMSWKGDATELAFVSTHENWCSLYQSDLFALDADGTDYRRVTQAPACADLADYPKGTVKVPVRNSSLDSFSGFLYFQGAPSLQPVNLPPFGTGMVTFENVADFGDGEDGLQIAMIVYGSYRELAFSTVVDVIAGGTVTTQATEVYVPSASWEVYSPTWSRDGSRIGHLLNGISLWQLPAQPEPLEFGSSLLAEEVRPGGYVGFLAWGPTPATADQLLYSKSFDESGVYLVREGSSDAGEALLSFESFEALFGLAWLPDGSGFVYSVTEGDYFGEDRSSDLFVYDFASGEATRVTSFVGDFTGQVSVSGDGQRFVFERAADLTEFGAGLLEPDLWLVNRDGSGLGLLVENAYAPAWSR
ncbi:MAG: Tol biopolymer transporter periplasmic protein [Deinococcota bacterium]|nr:Tol biopolymer transporter periplasmic protein [Deinococcota bacterium]